MNTNYFLNLVAGNIFRSDTDPAIPTKYYLGLSTTTPTITGTGVKEPSASAHYARVEIDAFTEPVSGVVKNKNLLEFNESTGNWGLITHYVVYDALTGGNLLMYSALTNPKTIEVDTIAIFREGEIEMSVANAS